MILRLRNLSLALRTLPIRTQLSLGMLAWVCVMGAILVIFIPSRGAEVLRQSEHERLRTMAETTAQFVFPGLDFHDESFVAETTRLLFAQPDVQQVQVFDQNSNLFSNERKTAGKPPSTDVMEIVVPVEQDGRQLGRLVLRTTTDTLEATISSMRWIVIGTTFCAILLGVPVIFLLGGYISRPLLRLKEATSRVAEGVFDVHVPVGARNELGDLAHHFNLMIDTLSRTTTSRDLLEKEAERREQALEEVRRLQKTAEIASRSKSEFLANMSHEIRTPMNAIIGLSDIALDGELSGGQRHNIETIQRSSQQLLGIINDVLDISKIEAGKLELNPESVDLAELLTDLALQQMVLADARELLLYSSIAPLANRWLMLDPLRLRQILTNLMGNAIKFTSKGSVSVRVVPESRGEDLWLVFEVEDTGIGIPKEKHASIFQPFEQADGSTTRNYGGTGLGLSIACRLVEKMGGEIGVQSELDHGTTFRFEIPVSAGQAKDNRYSGLVDRRVYLDVPDEKAEAALRHTVGFWGMTTVQDAKDAEILLTGFPVTLQRNPDTNTNTDSAVESTPLPVPPPFAPIVVAEALATCLGLALVQTRKLGTSEEILPEGTYRALLAEDNRANQLVAGRFLKRVGFEVDIAENGKAAVDLFFKNGGYAIVLMDWHMPEMNGIEATEEIRRREQGQRVPIIGLTANALPGDREACLKAGMDSYLSKPIQRREFERVVLDAAIGREGFTKAA